MLLVDTDLRRPRLHLAFGVKNTRGVSTYLSGMEADALQLVVPTGIENLELMPSGPIPPNPSELLNSPIFAGLGPQLLERRFDHILFDTPPVLSVSDPVIVASVADTGILIVRAGRTPTPSVRTAAARLAQTGGCTFGVVLNDFDAESQGAAHDRYPYYYGRYEVAADEPSIDEAPRADRRGA